MALTARVFRTNKRKNSTLQAAPGSSYETESIQLKESTDIIYPTFTFNKGMAWNPSALYNYMMVTELGRRYFINTWRWSNGLWECDCVCDVLGTYKSDILAMEKYVLRSALRTHQNGFITDGEYPVTGEMVHSSWATDCGWVRSWANGWYVVGIVGNNTVSNAGSVQYWVLTAAQLQSLVNFMLSGLGVTDWTLDDWKTEWQRIMADPFQYIVSCMYFPVQPPVDPLTRYITFGYWTTSIQGYMLSAPYDTYKYNLQAYYGNNQDAFGYVNAENWPEYIYFNPYSAYVLQFNPFGTIEIDGQLAFGASHIGVEMKVDFVSGTAVANFYAHDKYNNPTTFNRFDRFITTANAQLGVQIQLSQNTSSLIQRVAGISSTFLAGAAASAASPSTGLGAVGSILDDALLNPINGKFENRGTPGGIASDEGVLLFHIYRRWPTQFYAAELGYAVCKPLTLSTCSGYTLCADGSNTVAALDMEKNMIAEFLTSGFFIE